MKRAKKLVALFSAVLLLTALPALAFADEGGGSGSGKGGGTGSGGNSSEPLTVTSAKTDSGTIEDGSTIAPTDAITLTFSKNVCNESVREANKGLVEVTDSTGVPVAVEVVLYDDQVDTDKKHDITVKPQGSYAEGSYVLTAKKGITSKNSAALESDYVLHFNVKANAASTTSPSSSSSTGASTSSGSSANAINPALVGGIVVVIVIIVVVAIVVYTKKKKQ